MKSELGGIEPGCPALPVWRSNEAATARYLRLQFNSMQPY